MANPLFFGANNGGNGSQFQSFNGGSVIIPPQVKQAYNALKSAQNPQAAYEMLAQKNPQFANIMQMCRGQNPQQVFYSLCKQRGIDPNTIINQLR